MKKIKAALCAILAVLIVCPMFACAKTENEDDGKLKIVATLFPQYDFARSIAGDKAQVEMLLPFGADSHSFDPSMRDTQKIKDADIFVYTGEIMENWAEPFAKKAPEGCIVLDVSEKISPICLDEDHSDEHDHDHAMNVDPHIWTSPKNAIVIVGEILEAICAADPQNEEYYRENAAKYVSSLEVLDLKIKELAEGSRGKKLYFGGEFAVRYFVEEYGISYMTLYDSCSESAEPSIKAVAEMTDDMKQSGSKIVLYPELCDPKAARTIAAGVGAQIALFHSCHNVSKEEFDGGVTYLSLMEQNFEVLKEALS